LYGTLALWPTGHGGAHRTLIRSHEFCVRSCDRIADLLLHERAVFFLGPGSKNVNIRIENSDPTSCVQQHCNSEFVDMDRGDPVCCVSDSACGRRRDAITPLHDASLAHCPDLVLPGCLASRHSSFQRLLRKCRGVCSALLDGPRFCLSGPWI
jgi:hypothetical protein